jgi:integrase/recombinase XerD
MFEQLFERSHALTRQRSAPLADERRLYMIHCASQGMARSTLRLTAELLVAVEDSLKLAERPNSIISPQEIEEAGTRWASRRAVPPTRLHPGLSKQRFIRQAVRWLAFMERLQPACALAKPHEEKMIEFADFMLRDRGLSPATIAFRCQTVGQFLDQLCDGGRSLNDVTISEIDSILAARVNERHYVRASVQTHASSLRSFSDSQKHTAGAR